MKKFITALALTAVIASPAFAAKVKHQPLDANAQFLQTGADVRTSNGVYDASGREIGRDPDAFIRNSIRQNETAGQGGR